MGVLLCSHGCCTHSIALVLHPELCFQQRSAEGRLQLTNSLAGAFRGEMEQGQCTHSIALVLHPELCFQQSSAEGCLQLRNTLAGAF
ncbi:hypothetical protein Anapl_04342 [Anas platyrhynchos]|uniref:Uncharacterized protein n=1 Tax=Anas platyrhynchos TaxID=8839 RepID=R0L044_ANAPL|nr:hypothetical protein Anapl_04342 [Anas platyrhynchos]